MDCNSGYRESYIHKKIVQYLHLLLTRVQILHYYMFGGAIWAN